MLSDRTSWRPKWPLFLIALFLLAPMAWAQADDPAAAAAVGDVAAIVAEAPAPPPSHGIDTGSTAWMLVSSALVLFMIPGLALFYGGMVRAKNVLNMFLCCMVAIGVIGLQWVLTGYATAFPVVTDATSIISSGINGDAIISWLAFDPSLIALKAFNSLDPASPNFFGRLATSGDTSGAVSTGVPELAFVMFQGKFAIITPALIVGALAERIRFGPFVIFMLIWAQFVYDPVAHWVWNVNGWLFQWGVLDFAGGTVVHVLAGVSALAVCLVIGPRTGYGRVPMPPHSLGLTLIGAGLLWFGWFGFNAGSAIAVGGSDLPVAGWVAALALTNTQVAAAAAATAWMLVEWIHSGKPTILGFASGMVAGLVVITPCAGHVAPGASILIGGLGGVVCYFACRLKNVFKYDDSLDAFGVHGVGGALGAILVGYFAVRPAVGGMDQVIKQAVGVGVAALFAFVLSYVIALVIHKTVGLRASEEDELTGLDLSLHGEKGYHLEDQPVGGYTAEGHPDARGTAALAH